MFSIPLGSDSCPRLSARLTRSGMASEGLALLEECADSVVEQVLRISSLPFACVIAAAEFSDFASNFLAH